MSETLTSTEKLPNNTNKTELTPENIKEIRHNSQRLVDLEDILRTKYPDSYNNINKKHPEFFNVVNNLSSLGKTLGDENSSLTDQNTTELLTKYNNSIFQFNKIRYQLKLDENKTEESKLNLLNTFANGEGTFDGINEEEFTQEQVKELKQFSKDLWEEFFPESYVDKFTKIVSEEDELKDYQKLLIAPANGIENIVMGIGNLFNVETYDNIKTLTNLEYEDWCDLWKTIKYSYENLSTTDKITPIISLIFSIGFLIGGIGKITQLAEKLGVSSKVINTIKIAGTTVNTKLSIDTGTKVSLLGVIAGITLKQVK